MRSPADIYAELERDRTTRIAEIHLVENLSSRSQDEEERAMLRRSVVLLTYAHFEGFCKFALTAYASAVNERALQCRDVSTPLVAAALGAVFAALRDTNHKPTKELARELPDDSELHLLARHRSFIESYDEITAKRVEIPDKIVDTKSNLSAPILKKNLYQLGLDYPKIRVHEGSINKLVGVRNAIAHGDILERPSANRVAEYREAAFSVMQFVQQEVYDAVRNENFLRKPAAETPPPPS